jgi:hypothetical protein
MTFIRERLPDPTSYFESRGLKLSGPRGAKWKTTECTFHGGSDSMRVNTQSGGWVCMNCGAKGGDVLAYEMAAQGLQFVDAAKALGAWVDDGKPMAPQRPAPLPPRSALQVLAFEATLTAVAAGNLARGVILTDVDLQRLLVAARRIVALVEAYQ